jgi:thioredoxin-dependent peroxiredoxin
MAKLKIGNPAPDFTLPWTGEGSFSLSGRRGRWVVLAFYPGDFTPTCTKQFCNYRDGREQIEDLDADVVGISPQDVDSHERFIAEHDLTVPLAADVDKSVARSYGVLAPGGTLVRRAVFVVDPEGVIRYRKVALVGLGFEDTDDLRSALDEARSAAA